MKKALFLFLGIFCGLYANSLQEAIEKAAPYDTLKLSAGSYRGNIVITKPLTIIGNSSVIVGENKGSVITIKSDHVILENLTIQNSGQQKTSLDSGVKLLKSSFIQIKGCNFEDVLYGINIELSHHIQIKNNTIRSIDSLSLPQKGNGIKIWYSHDILISDNKTLHVKNNAISFSHHITLKNNHFKNTMFAIYFENSKNISVERNIFQYNSSAIVSMGTYDLKITKNDILSSTGAAGIGIVLGGGRKIMINGNRIRYNAKAFYIDSQFKEQGMQRFITKNEIAYNKEAFHFHQAIKNNTIEYNNIYGNISDVVKDTPNYLTANNSVKYNYWDQYGGFDKDGDGVGDMPYKVYQYSDKLWHFNNKIKFFFASPALSIINFLSKIAPFVPPNLLLEDEKPYMNLIKF